MAFDAATYTPAEREDYLRLLRDAWGDDTVAGAEFDWWFRGPAARCAGRAGRRPCGRRGGALVAPRGPRRP